ncbi:MAG TPA: hypothetical protein VJR46_01410 [Candidatus Dormibacteraeota bacterium]|nr:hypothetical protein [Candidatus Dormibacteraeota bacterium]
MATRKRTSRRSGLVDRAVSAGRRALREAEKRVPPDLRRQAERRIKDADKTARAAIKALQTQVNRASSRADVNSVLKRIDGLTKQARQVISGTGPRRAASTTRRAATRTRKAAGTAARKTKTTSPKTKTTTRRAATGKSSTRSSTQRRRARPAKPTVIETPMTPLMPEIGAVEIGPTET